MNLDSPTVARLQDLYPPFAQKILNIYKNFYEKYRLQLRCTDGLRDYDQQEKLFSQGRTTPGKIVTNAMPGQSLHNFGLAADSCFVGNDPYLEKSQDGSLLWKAFGDFCKLEGLSWGGDFKSINDAPHAESFYGYSIDELNEIYGDVGLDGLWREIDARSKEELHCLIN